MKHHDERRLFAAQGPDVLAVPRKDMLNLLDEIDALKQKTDIALMSVGVASLITFGIGLALGAALAALFA